jgi:hypothetical protein
VQTTLVNAVGAMAVERKRVHDAVAAFGGKDALTASQSKKLDNHIKQLEVIRHTVAMLQPYHVDVAGGSIGPTAAREPEQ